MSRDRPNNDGRVSKSFSPMKIDEVEMFADMLKLAPVSHPKLLARWILERFYVSRDMPFVLANDNMEPTRLY